jgi:pyruvate/2-oxoglutarate dehydrogenase complex dihydrolipoamide dehydrogenase (E3) component
MARLYDFVAIGGGSAGYNAARVAAGLGKKVAVIDGARDLGGLCILKGCMPSKTLIYAAEVLHLAQSGRSFGLNVRGASADMKAVQTRKKGIIRGFAKHRQDQLTTGKWDLIRSKARFIDAHTVELDNGKTVRSAHFLIGTGSRVSVPPVLGLTSVPFWTSDDVLDLRFEPRSVIVLGGGIVACELAQFLGRIGTRVCVIQRSPFLLKKNSKEAGAVVRSAFESGGIEVITDSKILQIAPAKGGVAVTFEQKGKSHTRHADHLFNALGREPNTLDLRLERAGVDTLPNGRILTNRWQQTSSPNIYAAGDCCGPHEIVHIAIQQAELAARHSARIKGLKPISDSMLLNVVFTDPQVASVGWSEHDLQKKRIPYESATHPFNDHGKSILMNAKYGFVRVLAHSINGRILGAEVVGKDAGELIHCFTTPLSMRATVHQMLAAPWYHPTLAEVLTYPLEEIADRLNSRKKR